MSKYYRKTRDTYKVVCSNHSTNFTDSLTEAMHWFCLLDDVYGKEAGTALYKKRAGAMTGKWTIMAKSDSL